MQHGHVQHHFVYPLIVIVVVATVAVTVVVAVAVSGCKNYCRTFYPKCPSFYLFTRCIYAKHFPRLPLLPSTSLTLLFFRHSNYKATTTTAAQRGQWSPGKCCYKYLFIGQFAHLSSNRGIFDLYTL